MISKTRARMTLGYSARFNAKVLAKGCREEIAKCQSPASSVLIPRSRRLL